MTKEEIQSAIQRQYEIILANEARLAAEDYKVIKCAEAKVAGTEMPYDSSSLIRERTHYRQAIEDARYEIERLEALMPEDLETEETEEIEEVTTADYAVTLERARTRKVTELNLFDSEESPDGVNCFYMGGQAMWLKKETRQSLAYSLERAQKAGESTIQIWYGTQSLTLPLGTVDELLTALEVYAKACYDVTASHKAAINALTSVEEVEAYDFKTGYPDKPHFDL